MEQVELKRLTDSSQEPLLWEKLENTKNQLTYSLESSHSKDSLENFLISSTRTSDFNLQQS